MESQVLWGLTGGSQLSVYQAEITKQLHEIQNIIQWDFKSKFSFFLISSDRLSGLLAMQTVETRDRKVGEIPHLIKIFSKFLYFNLVRGHADIELNKIADNLANEITNNSDHVIQAL